LSSTRLTTSAALGAVPQTRRRRACGCYPSRHVVARLHRRHGLLCLPRCHRGPRPAANLALDRIVDRRHWRGPIRARDGVAPGGPIMSVAMIGTLGVALLLALIFLRVPIAVALAASGLVGYAAIDGWSPALKMFGLVPYQLASAYSLSVIPLFILMGAVAARGKMAAELFQACNAVFSGIRGALTNATIGAYPHHCSGHATPRQQHRLRRRLVRHICHCDVHDRPDQSAHRHDGVRHSGAAPGHPGDANLHGHAAVFGRGLCFGRALDLHAVDRALVAARSGIAAQAAVVAPNAWHRGCGSRHHNWTTKEVVPTANCEAAAAQRLHLLEQRDRGVGDRTLALLRKTSLYGHVCSPILLR